MYGCNWQLGWVLGYESWCVCVWGWGVGGERVMGLDGEDT